MIELSICAWLIFAGACATFNPLLGWTIFMGPIIIWANEWSKIMKLSHTPDSSHIEHFSHQNGVMSVKFKNRDKVYHYEAPVEHFHQMKQARSAGQYFHAAKKGWKLL